MSILVALVSGFAGGVFFRSVIFEGAAPFIFALLLGGIFCGAWFLSERRAYTLAAIFCIALALGGWRMAASESPLPQAFVGDLKQRITYEAVVVGDPDLRDASQRVALRVSKGTEVTKVLAVAPRAPRVEVGDTVTVSGTLALPEPFADEGGRVFRYDRYLEREGIRFLLEFATLRVEEKASPYSLPAALARVKHAFVDGVNAALPEPYASLASGIVIGGKSGLGAELKETFTRSGLVHIVVLSGHNVMIVASWAIAFFVLIFARIETLFGKRVPRYASVALGALALILFVGIAGASSTAVRAALMALIALYARATARTYAASRALLVVILLMLLYNPLYLAFDPGFGLSVVATAGLIWLAPLLELWFDPAHHKRLFILKSEFVRSAVATTLAAQVAVLPLLLYQTGNLSLVAIPANIVASLFTPLAMAFSYLAGFGGMLFASLAPTLSIIIGLPAYLTAAALIGIAEASAALPLAAFAVPAFPFLLVLALYAGLAYATARLKRSSATPQLTFVKKAST